jgi:hypothetical protein
MLNDTPHSCSLKKEGAVPKGQPHSRLKRELARIGDMKKKKNTQVVFKPY